MIEQDLRTYLLSQPAVSALIGTRVYPVKLPQGAQFPAVTYQRVGGGPQYSHDGATDLARARVQIDCWSQSYGGALALGEAVKQALKPQLSAALGATPRIVNELDLDEPELLLWRRMLDVALWHKEA